MVRGEGVGYGKRLEWMGSWFFPLKRRRKGKRGEWSAVVIIGFNEKRRR